MAHVTCSSPLGDLTLFEEDGAIIALEWGAAEGGVKTPLLKQAVDQLESYFMGERKLFDLPLNPFGTAFQKKLWKALSDIPHGQTLTYGELAHKIDSGPRAIGGACGKNPIPIIIPCHRVLASGGRMGGYSGLGEVDTKQFLLRLEGALL